MQKDFIKICTRILIALVIAILFLFISSLTDHVGQETYLNWFYILLVPAILLIGLILFIVESVRYIRNKSYFSGIVRIRNIGGLMGLIWFAIIEFGVLLLLWIHFDGKCEQIIHYFSTPPRIPCSFFEFLTNRSLESMLFPITLMFVGPLPIIMYIIGFFVDRYTTKKIRNSQAVN